MHTNIIVSDDLTRAHYKQTFEYIMEHAPYLGSLLSKKKKHEELTQLIGEVCNFPLVLIATHYQQMQNMINHTCSKDASHLKICMGSSTAPQPNKELIYPPIADDSKNRAKKGFNHVQLGKMLCPAKHLVNYIKDSTGYILFY
jgi:hypothetical protein